MAQLRRSRAQTMASAAPFPALAECAWHLAHSGWNTVPGPDADAMANALATDRAALDAYRAAHPGAHEDVLACHAAGLDAMESWAARWCGTPSHDRFSPACYQGIPAAARAPRDPNVDPFAAYDRPMEDQA